MLPIRAALVAQARCPDKREHLPGALAKADAGKESISLSQSLFQQISSLVDQPLPPGKIIPGAYFWQKSGGSVRLQGVQHTPCRNERTIRELLLSPIVIPTRSRCICPGAYAFRGACPRVSLPPLCLWTSVHSGFPHTRAVGNVASPSPVRSGAAWYRSEGLATFSPLSHLWGISLWRMCPALKPHPFSSLNGLRKPIYATIRG